MFVGIIFPLRLATHMKKNFIFYRNESQLLGITQVGGFASSSEYFFQGGSFCYVHLVRFLYTQPLAATLAAAG